MSVMAVEFSDVSKSYPLSDRKERVQALRNVSFRAEPGEFVCLLGPSGCGKSTLLKLVAGLEFPDEGVVQACGERVRWPRVDCGMVFQDYALFPWLNVEQNVSFGLELRGYDKAAIRELVSRFILLIGLQGFEKSYPRELSGGMKQRVALARVLVMASNILLMDEPFGALDSFTRMEMQEELVRLWQRRPSTVLFVTHDIEEAIYLADRIVVMTPRPGRIKTVVPVSLGRPRQRADRDFTSIRQHVLNQYERSNTLTFEPRKPAREDTGPFMDLRARPGKWKNSNASERNRTP